MESEFPLGICRTLNSTIQFQVECDMSFIRGEKSRETEEKDYKIFLKNLVTFTGDDIKNQKSIHASDALEHSDTNNSSNVASTLNNSRTSTTKLKSIHRIIPTDEHAKQMKDKTNLIFESFEAACKWSKENDGRPFTRTLDGFYFTPVDKSSVEPLPQYDVRRVA